MSMMEAFPVGLLMTSLSAWILKKGAVSASTGVT